jgi:hypothetical protein
MRNVETAIGRTSALGRARLRIASFVSAYPSGILTNNDLASQLGVDIK